MDYSLPVSIGHGIFQAKILEWVAISFSRGSSWPRGRTWVSCIAGRFFTVWATREAQTTLHFSETQLQNSSYNSSATFNSNMTQSSESDYSPLVASLLLLFSHSIVSDSLWPHELWYTRLPCPLLSPRVCSKSCSLSWWCHSTIYHPLPPPSPFTFNLSQRQGLFQWVECLHQVAKVLELRLQDQHQSFQCIFRVGHNQKVSFCKTIIWLCLLIYILMFIVQGDCKS